jgi:hypothetical protein
MRNKSLLWALLISFLSSCVVSGAAMVAVYVSNADNNRQWCELLVTLDHAYSSTPPASELGRKVANAIGHLSTSFGCKG